MGEVPNLAIRRFFPSPQGANPGWNHCGIDGKLVHPSEQIPQLCRERGLVPMSSEPPPPSPGSGIM